jgi:hypothetical protein
MHMIWFSIVVPAMVFVVWAFPITRSTSIWSLSFGIAIPVIACLAGFDVFVFIQQGGSWSGVLKRSVFSLAMNTDIPMIQFSLGCIVNWAISKRTGIPGGRQSNLTPVPRLP